MLWPRTGLLTNTENNEDSENTAQHNVGKQQHCSELRGTQGPGALTNPGPVPPAQGQVNQNPTPLNQVTATNVPLYVVDAH